MQAEEFSAWFSGVGRLSAEQRREVAAALANLDGGLRRAGETETSAAGGAADKGAKRGRHPDALGTSGHERVASQGCPHCAGRAIIAWAWSNQRSLLCRCAIVVLVSALKVRPQALQRNRESPCERPQATIARPAQCGQPWLATRSWPLVPKASG